MAKIPTSTMIKVFGEEVDIWPQFCTNDRHCVQCVIEGKIQCAPRWRRTLQPKEKTKLEILPGYMARTCQHCGSKFSCRIDIANRGGGLYCCRPCAAKATIGKRMQNRLKNPVKTNPLPIGAGDCLLQVAEECAKSPFQDNS